MAVHGEVVFQAGQNDGTDSDIWDDTALIKAYDEAINSFKAQMNADKNEEQESNNSETTPKRTGKKGKHRRKKRKSSHKQKWRVGDHCSAHFSEDNLVYNAIIKSVNYKLGTCWITYVGYGNEEEKDLDELMAPVQDRLSQEEDSYFSENGYESVDMDTMPNPEQSPHYPGPGSYPSPNQHERFYPPPGPSSWHFGRIPPWSSPQFPVSLPYPYDYGMVAPPPPRPTHRNGPWGIPPPPPPPPTGGDDGEALHAMLMAWYMSGYHTGYYQGTKNAQKKHLNESASDR